MTDHAQRAREIAEILANWVVTKRPVYFECETVFKKELAAALDQAAQPVWSTDRPTVAGWYWWRGQHHHEDSPQVVDVFLMPAGSTLGVSFNSDYYTRLDVVCGEWAGPLSSPKERDEK